MRASYRFAMAGVAALALLGAGCSSGSSSGSASTTNWATVTSASAGGGMSALVAAAKKEGTLNVIALPPDLGELWQHHQGLPAEVRDQGQLGATRRWQQPAGGQRDQAGERHRRGAGRRGRRQAVALANTSLFASVQGEHLECHPGQPEGIHRALVRGLRRLHVDRLQLDQVRDDHLGEPAARAEVQGRGGAERRTRPGQRRAERCHDGEPGQAAARPGQHLQGRGLLPPAQAGRQLRAGDRPHRRHDQGRHDPGRDSTGTT